MSDARPPAPPVLHDLGYLLRQAAGTHRIRVDRALADLGATAPQLLVLTLIERDPGCSSADLARRALLTTPTIGAIVATLVAGGAVSRRAHATHGRKQQLDLTAAGAALLAACRTRVVSIEAELNDGLSPADADHIRAWLLRAGTPA